MGKVADSNIYIVLSEKSSLGKWGMVTLGLSGVFLIAGTITGIVSTTKLNTLIDRCPDNTCTGPSDQSLKEEVDSLALATDILLPIGGALALTGVLLLMVDKKTKPTGTPCESSQNSASSYGRRHGYKREFLN